MMVSQQQPDRTKHRNGSERHRFRTTFLKPFRLMGEKFLETALGRKYTEKKEKAIEKMEVLSEGIINKIGPEKSFTAAKAMSIVDIGIELLALGVTSFAFAKTTMPAIKELVASIQSNGAHFYTQLWEHFTGTIIPMAAKLCLPTLVLLKIGNWLDILQHLFVKSLKEVFPEKKKERADAVYEKFSAASIKEQLMDHAIEFFVLCSLLPLVTRIKAISLEVMQWKAIRKMERLYRMDDTWLRESS